MSRSSQHAKLRPPFAFDFELHGDMCQLSSALSKNSFPPGEAIKNVLITQILEHAAFEDAC